MSAARTGRFVRKEQYYASLPVLSCAINANQEARLTTSHQLTSLWKNYADTTHKWGASQALKRMLEAIVQEREARTGADLDGYVEHPRKGW